MINFLMNNNYLLKCQKIILLYLYLNSKTYLFIYLVIKTNQKFNIILLFYNGIISTLFYF